MSKKPKNNCQNPYHLCYDNYLDTNACSECTGLIPAPVRDENEWENYKELYAFTPADRNEDTN